MYAQALDEGGDGYEGPRNKLINYRDLVGAEFRTVVGANNNVIYTLCWLDFSAGPLVITAPPISEDRYFVFQFADFYTHNYDYISPRVTGSKGGTFLLTGPDWNGEKPEGITDIFKSEGNLSYLLFRLYVAGKTDIEAAREIQESIKLVTLNEYLGEEPSNESLTVYPAFDETTAKSIDFISYFNFIMTQVDIHPTEAVLFKRFEKIGIAPGKSFDKSSFDPQIAKAMEEGVQEALKEIPVHMPTIGRQINGWGNFAVGFGNREAMQGKYLDRAAAAMIGIYGNSPAENGTYTTKIDTDGEPLDASKYNYVMELSADQLPPVYGFWSLTMYDEESFMVVNPINKYSVFGEDERLTYGKDGSLTIYIQSESPGAYKEGNWLPAPDGIFGMALRLYWPKEAVLDGSWSPPTLMKVKK
jgi:hypothetical protein